MKTGNPKTILNPYEWLPSYGESRVSFRSNGLDVVLDIDYEKDMVDSGGLSSVLVVRRELKFSSARYFLRLPFPGNDFFEFVGDADGFKLGELIEFEDSELLQAGEKMPHAATRTVLPPSKHFSIPFLSENVVFHVLAKGVTLSGEMAAS